MASSDAQMEVDGKKLNKHEAGQKELRFKIGDNVQAMVGYWCNGTIVDTYYVQDGEVYPYQIKLENGDLVFAPEDIMRYVRPVCKQVPVTILTGFLGAGKTTLLNHILGAFHGKKIGVVENEFGSISIDDKLIKHDSKRTTDNLIVEMKNGCICCTVRQDLGEAFKDMLEKMPDLDNIIVETTGLADPAPIIQTFCLDDYVAERAKLDAVVTVVDSKNILMQLDREPAEGAENEAVEQVAFADVVLVNKIDLVEPEELDKIEKRLKSINGNIKMMRTQFKKEVPPLDKILDQNCFDLQDILKNEPDFLKDEDHQHDESVNSFSRKVPGNVHMDQVNEWVRYCINKYQPDLYRWKGILAVQGFKQKVVFQGVHMLLEMGPSKESWGPDEKRESTVVFIGKKVKAKESDIMDAFEYCLVDKKDQKRAGKKL